QNVLAGGRCGERLVAVQLVGGRDVDGVDLRVGQECVETVRASRDAVLTSVGTPALRVRAHHGDDLSRAICADCVDHPLACDRAGADQAPFYRHETLLSANLLAPQLSRTTS